jgi:hypothetical protein
LDQAGRRIKHAHGLAFFNAGMDELVQKIKAADGILATSAASVPFNPNEQPKVESILSRWRTTQNLFHID